MSKHINIFALFLLSCTSPKSNVVPDSCVKAVTSDSVNINNVDSNVFYWGILEVKYQPELTSIVFSHYSKKNNQIKNDPNQPYTCKIFFVPNGEYLDGWSSRHCLFKNAISSVKYFMLDDKNEKIELKELENQNESKSLAKGWDTISKSILELKSVKQIPQEQLDAFVVRYLHHNSYNSKLYTWVEQALEDSSRRILSGKGDGLSPKTPDYYRELFKKSNANQLALRRDVCTTDFIFKNLPSNFQQVCFSITDMTVTRFKMPKELKKKSKPKTELYDPWLNAHQNLNKKIDAFIASEAVFRLAVECKKMSGKPESCAVSKQLNDMISAGEQFKSVGLSTGVLEGIKSKVFEAPSKFSPEIFKAALNHRLELLEAYNTVGLLFPEIINGFVEIDTLGLAGLYKNKSTDKKLMGYINFKQAFEGSVGNLDVAPDGFVFLTNSDKVRFELSDSGSLIFNKGFPIAALSTVNGESSSGGASSTGDISTYVAADIIAPEDLQPEVPNEIAQSTNFDPPKPTVVKETVPEIEDSPDIEIINTENISNSSTTTDIGGSSVDRGGNRIQADKSGTRTQPEETSSNSNSKTTPNEKVEGADRQKYSAEAGEQPGC